MRVVYLLFGSLLTVFLFIKIPAGGKYQYMVEYLDNKEYPLKSLYGIGFAWSETKLLGLKGKIKDTLMGQAKLLYDPKFAEYYASVTWAQVITFVYLSIAVGFILAGVLNSAFMLLVGFGIGGFLGFYCFTRMKECLKTREIVCTSELPEIVSTMALLINAGMMLRNAWRTIADSKDGEVYQLMRQSCSDMDNGVSEVDAIYKFGKLSNSQEIRKFSSALAQSIERGGSELADFLGRQSIEMWHLKKQLMLQKGEAAASKLLAPTVMLFVGVIIAVISGALGMLI